MSEKTVFFRADPVWERLRRQPSYGEFIRECSKADIHLDTTYSHITRGYRTEIVSIAIKGDHAYKTFIAEGYGEHPLGSMRAAVARDHRPVPPRVRSTLLAALMDFLAEEIEFHGLGNVIRGWVSEEG